MRANQLFLLIALAAPGLMPGQQSPLRQAWDLTNRARQAARSEHPQDSFPLYEQALELAPDETGIRRDFGVALGWSGEYRRAAEAFRLVRAAAPKQPAWARLEMANAELFGGSALEAVVLYDSLIKERDLREPILTRRALALRRAGRRDQAADAYRDTLIYYPDSETAALGIVECFLDRGQVDEAHAFLATWSAGRPRSPQIRAWRGWLLTLLGRYDEADVLFASLPADDFQQNAAILGRALTKRFQSTPYAIAAWPSGPTELTPAVADLRVELAQASTERPQVSQAEGLARDGVALAREGSIDVGITYLRRAVAMAPAQFSIRRDYATVLTWGERYLEARREFDYVFRYQPDQPAWARSDRAQAELFGGDPEGALEILNGLLRDGFMDERNFIRKGLALRWSGHSEEAERLYRQIAAMFPDSSAGPDGLIQSLADQNRLGSAIKAANESLTRLPNHWDLVKSRAQVLNWAGRHLEAEKTLETIPREQAFDETVLHQRALAARWSDDAKAATEFAKTFVQRYPGDREAYRLREELAYQYGYALRSGGDYFGDTDGFVARGLRQDFEAPLSAGHRLEVGFRRQFFDQNDEHAQWTTYGIGWSGHLSRRLSTHLSAGQAFYGEGERSVRPVFDASASLLASDRVRLRGGLGEEPTTAFHAVQKRVQTQYGYVESDFKPTLKTQLGLRASTTSFGESTIRRGLDVSAFLRFFDKRYARLRFGTRNSWMFHDRPSPDVYSPESLRTHLAVIHFEGSWPGSVDYVGEVGTGLQFETGSPRTIPLSTTIELAKRLRQDIWLRLQAGHSNSAVDRTNAGLSSYRMSYLSLQLDYRLRREY